ncbi:hypothetical protein B0T24DRAFT_724661 [Lasiosphaeria ovina]|uniref:Uncharacterized protein n=1 Tax=Lasiosphaeria ovina TaxID=92902 RepID=A0AAE0JTW2_9PEZI|nr:hypothetical protein B0T24DRAFT_724661 [Lasiosphaeria ovina]
MRLAAGLPISLLELNTFAHVVFAVYVFAAWWDKPLDINEPVIISLDRGDNASELVRDVKLTTVVSTSNEAFWLSDKS